MDAPPNTEPTMTTPELTTMIADWAAKKSITIQLAASARTSDEARAAVAAGAADYAARVLATDAAKRLGLSDAEIATLMPRSGPATNSVRDVRRLYADDNSER